MTLRLSRGESSGPLTAEDIKYDLISQIRRLVPDEPDKAMAAINNIQDAETKAEALSMAAQSQQATEFATQAQQTVATRKAPQVRFQAACARLQADAASKKRSALPQDHDEVFQLADSLMRNAREEKKDTFNIVEPLSQTFSIVMQVEPELTAARIDQLSLPFEKASLLSDAAAWLAPPMAPTRSTSIKPETRRNRQTEQANIWRKLLNAPTIPQCFPQ